MRIVGCLTLLFRCFSAPSEAALLSEVVSTETASGLPSLFWHCYSNREHGQKQDCRVRLSEVQVLCRKQMSLSTAGQLWASSHLSSVKWANVFPEEKNTWGEKSEVAAVSLHSGPTALRQCVQNKQQISVFNVSHKASWETT